MENKNYLIRAVKLCNKEGIDINTGYKTLEKKVRQYNWRDQAKTSAPINVDKQFSHVMDVIERAYRIKNCKV